MARLADTPPVVGSVSTEMYGRRARDMRANAALVAAVALGDSTALVLSLVGLGALLATSAFWFTVVKWTGGLYLLYLGIKLLRAGASPASPVAAAAASSRWKLFANT